VHATTADVLRDAVVKMDGIMAAFTFTDPKIRAAATAFVEGYRGRIATARTLGHWVGMEVHDVSGGRPTPLTYEPGMIFTIEPAMQIEDERLGLRLEDMILITTSGYENLSAFVPVDIAAIETLMKEPGLSDAALKR